jgi:DNA-binding NarL/FixJ family response regulator
MEKTDSKGPEMQVIVADDETKVRSALQLLLEQEVGLQVAGEAIDMAELLSRVASSGPELLLLDWELPGLTADHLETLRSRHPRLQIIALSGRPDARRAALVAGVDDFISKGSSPDLLLTAIRSRLQPSYNGCGPRANHKPSARHDGAPVSLSRTDAGKAGGKS